jgi:nitrite reductase (NO-forming)
MTLPGNRNDRALFGAVGAMVGAALLLGVGIPQFETPELMTSTAHAAITAAQDGVPPLAHVKEAKNPATIARSPVDLPQPIGDRAPQTVRVELETIEKIGQLADGTTYRYWTFNGQVPGPLVRVRVGDTVQVSLKNHEDSWMQHNVDFHAVTGPGGGGVATVADPGQTKGFTFKAINPGLYVYHCAIPMAAQHIANGMYGMILVEPEGGLPKVDREFYVMQGEIYTEQPFGTAGEATESYDKLLNEQPEYYVFNGAANALQGENALKAKVGETIRIYFGVGGPNKTSSFHVIGEIFDKVYELASLTREPLSDVQTITVPPGGASAVDIKLEVPGKFMLVDHALSRAVRGLIGTLDVEGAPNPQVFTAPEDTAMGEMKAH